MIPYPPSLKAVGGARTGIAPVNLLDVQDVNGNLYYWSDRPSNAPVVLTGAIPAYAAPPVALGAGQSIAWAFPTTLTSIVEAGPTWGSSAAPASVFSADGRTNTSVVNTSGGGVGGGVYTCQWSGFALPPMPGGASIQAIYGVVIAGGALTHSDFPGGPNAVNGPVQQLNGTSLGTSPDWSTLAFRISADLNGGDAIGAANFNCQFIGLAVYYTMPGDISGWGYPGLNAYGSGPYSPWLVEVPGFTFHRSLQTDVGSFVIQNLSGDTLSRDFEKIARRSALEGAMFVYRLWQADAQAAWLEVHGTLTVQSVGVDTVKLKGQPCINPSQHDTPDKILCETCQLQYGGRRCGATSGVECNYSFQTCQVVERIFVILNNYEKNYGEAVANTASNVINRRRKI